jgi:hypothetical protein
MQAATFASNRPGVLVVGGGGGAGRSGVKNQITAYDFTSRAPTIQSFAEIEASKDDSITCLDNLSTKDGLILFAGNGSSEEERLKGNNEHLRAFELKYPKSAEKTDGKVDFVSKTQLFKTPKSDGGKKEGYQRIAKLSPARRTTSSTPSRRIGAIASSLAGDENEIVIFSATSTKPADQDVIGRIDLHQGQEANDLDIFTQEEGEFRIAYVTDSNVFVQDVNWDFDQRKTKGKNEHRKLYTIPHVEKGAKSKLRCVRWLSSKHLLLLKNLPNRTGVELLLIHLYEDGPASVVLRKTLPKHVKAATDMDVSLLDADEDGAYQIAIAVAAIDISLTVYTMDYHGPARDSLSSFHAFNSYDNVSGKHTRRIRYMLTEAGSRCANDESRLLAILQARSVHWPPSSTPVLASGKYVVGKHDQRGDLSVAIYRISLCAPDSAFEKLVHSGYLPRRGHDGGSHCSTNTVIGGPRGQSYEGHTTCQSTERGKPTQKLWRDIARQTPQRHSQQRQLTGGQNNAPHRRLTTPSPPSCHLRHQTISAFRSTKGPRYTSRPRV